MASETQAQLRDKAPASTLLEQTDIGEELLRDQAAGAASGADFADIYLESSVNESWGLDEGRISRSSHSSGQGMSLRVACGEATAFASADLLDKATLARLASVANDSKRHIAEQRHPVHLTKGAATEPMYPPDDFLASFDVGRRVALLQEIDEKARGSSDKVVNVLAGLSMSHKRVTVARSDGELFADARPIFGLNVSVIVTDNGKTEIGDAGIGGRGDPGKISSEDIASLVDEALRIAQLNLTATPTPAGMMPVVLGNGWAGILLHEAIGHGLEGDFNRKGQSAFSGRIGERVAPAGVTVVDDGTLYGRRGSLTRDDEGVPTSCTTLIEDGILRCYMQDLLNASLMGASPTGNGRRESYSCEPMPRMTNTYMLAGEHEPEEIIASVERGIYCKSFNGGSVDITNGNFNFDVKEAYLIEGGKLGRHVKGATVIGNGPQSMTKMSMVGNDLELDAGVGTCGKNGQWVPVGVGQPHCKVDEMLVGGTEAGR